MMRAMLAAAVLVLFSAAAAAGQSREDVRGEVVDRMVATVNGSLITYSDLLWQVALQPDAPLDRPRPDDLRRALELLVDQRLIFAEAHGLPHIEPKAGEVERALADLVRRFPSRAEFQARASRVGLTAERLREIVSERVEIVKYLDFRFRSFVVVTPQEVEGHYRDSYVPRFRRRSPGRVVPKLEEARAEIEKALAEEKVSSDMGKFLEDVRGDAEIVILSPP